MRKEGCPSMSTRGGTSSSGIFFLDLVVREATRLECRKEVEVEVSRELRDEDVGADDCELNGAKEDDDDSAAVEEEEDSPIEEGRISPDVSVTGGNLGVRGDTKESLC
jgi:hypothetical protein